MHKVVTINLNGRGYQVDDDAFEALRAPARRVGPPARQLQTVTVRTPGNPIPFDRRYDDKDTIDAAPIRTVGVSA